MRGIHLITVKILENAKIKKINGKPLLFRLRLYRAYIIKEKKKRKMNSKKKKTKYRLIKNNNNYGAEKIYGNKSEK